MSKLYLGDNLDVLRDHVPDASVDLVYLDPPFQSGRDYHLAFTPSRARSATSEREGAEAFTDTWKWGPGAEAALADVGRRDGRVAKTMEALRSVIGDADAMAYLCMMAPRLIELRRVLKESGSLYLHCDPTASHYLKVLLDGVFGTECFRNEVIWRYRRWPAKARRFQRMHDVILFYTANGSGTHTFHTLHGYEKLAESTLKTFGTKKQRADFSSGHRKPGVESVETSGPPLADHWDLDDAPAPYPLSDAWEVGVIAAIGKERTGYPTQKPEALLERIIRASSSEGDVVLDPFCGCGTTMAVAERYRRQWIGIDLSDVAIEAVRRRMQRARFEFQLAFAPASLHYPSGAPQEAHSMRPSNVVVTVGSLLFACGGGTPAAQGPTPGVTESASKADAHDAKPDPDKPAHPSGEAAASVDAPHANGASPPSSDGDLVAPPSDDPWMAPHQMPPGDVLKTMRAAVGKVNACHAAAKKRDPSVSGEVKIKFVITHEGVVRVWRDEDSSMSDPDCTKCLGDLIQTLKFPTQKSPGEAWGVYSINFGG
jgi:DNA modification methylase